MMAATEVRHGELERAADACGGAGERLAPRAMAEKISRIIHRLADEDGAEGEQAAVAVADQGAVEAGQRLQDGRVEGDDVARRRGDRGEGVAGEELAAVEPVADEGMPRRGEVHAHLVAAPAMRLDVEQNPAERKRLWTRIVDVEERALERPEQAMVTLARALGEDPSDNALRDRAERAALLVTASEKCRALLNAEHRAILASIRAGRTEDAVELLDAHLRNGRDRIFELLEQRYASSVLPSSAREITVLLGVSNFHYPRDDGGSSTRVGTMDQLRQRRDAQRARDHFLVGFILVVGIYRWAYEPFEV